MYLSTQQIKLEMHVKEAEFARELKRARQSESRTIYLLSELITKMGNSMTQAIQSLFSSPKRGRITMVV